MQVSGMSLSQTLPTYICILSSELGPLNSRLVIDLFCIVKCQVCHSDEPFIILITQNIDICFHLIDFFGFGALKIRSMFEFLVLWLWPNQFIIVQGRGQKSLAPTAPYSLITVLRILLTPLGGPGQFPQTHDGVASQSPERVLASRCVSLLCVTLGMCTLHTVQRPVWPVQTTEGSLGH